MSGKKRKIADSTEPIETPIQFPSTGPASDDGLDEEGVDVPDQADGDDGGLQVANGGVNDTAGIGEDDDLPDSADKQGFELDPDLNEHDRALSTSGSNNTNSDSDSNSDEYLDPFEDELNPDSRDQRLLSGSSDSDSGVSEWEEEGGSGKKSKKGKGRAVAAGGRGGRGGKGGKEKGAGSGRGRKRVEEEEEDEDVGLLDDDDRDAGEEFEDLVANIQTQAQTQPEDPNSPLPSPHDPNRRHPSNPSSFSTSAIASDMLQIRAELAQAAGFKQKGLGRGRGRSTRSSAAKTKGGKEKRVPRERVHSKEINDLLGEGNAAWGMGDLSTARVHMWEVIRLDSTIDEAWMTLASIFREEGKLEKEMACLFTAAHCKKDAETWRDLADRSADQGRWEQAVYCVNRACRCEPGDKGLVYSQAGIFQRAGMLDKSWKSFQTLLKDAPYDIFLLKETLDLFHPLNRIEEGIQYFDNAFRYHTQTFTGPDDTTTPSDYSNALDYDFVNSLVDLFLAGGQWDEAGLTIKRAQRWFQGRREEDYWDSQQDDGEFDPEDAGRLDERAERDGLAGAGDTRGGYTLPGFLRWRLAIVRLKMGWDLDAEIHTKEFLKDDSVESLRTNHQGWSNIGLAMIQRNMFEKARTVYEDLWEKLLGEPELMDPDWIARAGTCRLEEKMYQDAIEAFDLVLEFQKDSYDGWQDPEVMKQKARAYVGLNDIVTADQIYTELREIEKEQALAAGIAETEVPTDTNALIPRRAKPKKTVRKTAGMSRREREEAEAAQSEENMEVLREYQDAAFAGDEEAIEAYLETAGAMIADFRAASGLFPVDKTRKYVKPGEGLKYKSGYQPGPITTTEGPDGEAAFLAPLQRVEFQGLHADVWIDIFVRYCCLLMLRGEELTALDIVSHVGWSNMFDPPRYVLALQLTALAAAIRLNDQDQIAKACRTILHKFQFRRDTVAIWQAAVGTGASALEAATNMNLQKFLGRDLRLWDAAVRGKDVQFFERVGRYVWHKDAEDKNAAAGRRVRREERAQRKNAWKEQALAKKGNRPRGRPGKLAGKDGKSAAKDGKVATTGLSDEDPGPAEEDISPPGEEDDEDPSDFFDDEADDDEEEVEGDAVDVAPPEVPIVDETGRHRSNSQGSDASGDSGSRFFRTTAPPKPKKIGPHVYMAYGQTMQMAKSYQSAIYYFIRAYEINPYDPLLCLHLAQSYFGRAMNRQSDNRLNQISTGMAFMNRYRRLMEAQNEDEGQMDEVEFNFGRAFHGLGILHLAAKHYQTVLARISTRMEANNEPEAVLLGSIARDAAYNLCLIFQLSGSFGLVKAITRQWLTL